MGAEFALRTWRSFAGFFTWASPGPGEGKADRKDRAGKKDGCKLMPWLSHWATSQVSSNLSWRARPPVARGRWICIHGLLARMPSGGTWAKRSDFPALEAGERASARSKATKSRRLQKSGPDDLRLRLGFAGTPFPAPGRCTRSGFVWGELWV